MTYLDFEMAFWHPFGPHSGESAEGILDRKATEAASNGWTLWSFGSLPRPCKPLFDKWCHELSKTTSDIYAFCSNGSGVDPSRDGGVCCSRWKPHGKADWRHIPDGVQVPHGFNGNQQYACAFLVSDVIRVDPGKRLPVHVEWLDKNGRWRREKLPTRGEKLVRPCSSGAALPKKGICAVLKLKPPYLAYLERPR